MTSLFTRAVHAGERLPAPDYTPTTTPIHPAVTYLYDAMEDLDAVLGRARDGFVYRRYGNPTTHAFEVALADLENADVALTYASGMAAMVAALLAAGVQAGARVVAARDCYGATYTLLDRLLKEQGVTTHFVDVTNLDEVAAVLRATAPTVLVCETISNPLLKVANVPALVNLAHAAGAMVIVDSTFTTPYLLRPLEHGADFVVHSVTKYIGGHDDVLGGAVVTGRVHEARLTDQLKMLGANFSPFEAWLALRGLKTLPLRMRQHCASALQVAAWLGAHPRVAQVNYPGLPGHPQHAVAAQLLQAPDGQSAYGGMVSFVIRDAGQAQVRRFLERARLLLTGTSLGDVYSLLLYPVMASHRALTPAQRALVGIGEGLVRLSVGIEEPADIIADLAQALEAD
ncbi:PLP-dependent aspartate aminotransferase family protein [Candidatus Amarolinea dominans]|uniref:trans-sulfuration enzyme family protein n=2 Tax=Candidatus Amarolinea dominans TaxID=3140696 RepID=UPI001DEE5FA8|nr:PLP-dependent transferase [Anaerolineae bacterium]